MARKPSVSVVIPTFNRKHSLLRALSSLPSDVEVIVVDDGSSDGTEHAVYGAKHPRLVFVGQENRGPAAARNAGLAIASAPYVAFTDDDCVPVPPWPWPLVERLEQEDERVAGVGGAVRPLNEGVLSRYYTFHRILEPPPTCAYLVTANCTYRLAQVLAVGGFDATIRQAGGEDPDLSMRIRASGFRFVFEPRGIVLHDYRESLRDFVRTFYRYGRGCGYVMDKRTHPPAAILEDRLGRLEGRLEDLCGGEAANPR